MLSTIVRGPDGQAVSVSDNGEVRVAPLHHNQLATHTMDTIDTPYVFAIPIVGQQMVMQNILLYANKSVGANDATIEIYTAQDPTATSGTTVMTFELPKTTHRDMIGLNVSLAEGLYLLAKTDDATVFATMMGYYEDV